MNDARMAPDLHASWSVHKTNFSSQILDKKDFVCLLSTAIILATPWSHEREQGETNVNSPHTICLAWSAGKTRAAESELS